MTPHAICLLFSTLLFALLAIVAFALGQRHREERDSLQVTLNDTRAREFFAESEALQDRDSHAQRANELESANKRLGMKLEAIDRILHPEFYQNQTNPRN